MKDFAEKVVSFNHVSPAFFIGLGGSGSDVVDRIAGKLKSRWNWESLEGLVQFFALDTNTHDLEKLDEIPRDNRLLISDFDKQSYVEQKRGKGFQEEDEFLTQWVHDWYDFRGKRGAGAGQIRIESRLGLYYQLEEDRGHIVRRFENAIGEALDHENPYRQNEPPHFEVFVYGSVAGGTGSGAFLPLAYLLRDVIEGYNWIPRLIGNLMLPSLFLNDVPRTLHPDINANGYAALKELEHLMKLGTESGISREEFHYNPERDHDPLVESQPYEFTYIADKPSSYEIDEYKNAIADSAYLLLYSPLLGAQTSNLDNYDKHQKGLAAGYTVYYGSNNCAVLILPDDDILEYSSMRYAAHAMREYLLFRGSGDDSESFAIDFEDPEFRKLSKQAQAERIDESFEKFVEYKARQEKKDDIEGGPYQRVTALKTPTDTTLPEEFDRVVEQFRKEIREKIDLHTLSATDIVESNIKIDSEINDLRTEINRARTAIREHWEIVRREIETGQTIQEFFEDHRTNPYAQRLFLIRQKRDLRERIDELQGRVDSISDEVDLSGDQVSEEIAHHRDRLEETAEWTLTEKVKGDNEDFVVARNSFLNYFNGTIVDGNRELLLSEFELEYLRAAMEHFEERLESFRRVASQAAQSIRDLEEDAEYARQTGRFPHGDGRANAYILDVEALEEIGGERLWDLYFEDRFLAEGRDLNYFDEEEIFSVITEAFNPAEDDEGNRSSKSAEAITDLIREGLTQLGRDRLGPEIVGTSDGGEDLSKRGLLLNDALEFEAKYHFRRQLGEDDPAEEPTRDRLENYLKNKIRFCAKKADPLATFIQSEHPDVVNSESQFIGLHEAYDDYLGDLVDQVVPEGKLLPNWYDEKSIVFYKTNLNIPLFYYKRLNDEMKHDYRRVMERDRDERGYPVHIDSNWEEGLADLDPAERREAAQKNAFDEKVIDFAVGLAIGVFREDPETGDVFWHAEQYSEKLGDDLVDAFDGFDRLDDRTRRKLESSIREARNGIEEGTEIDAIDEFERYVEELDERIWRLERDSDPAAKPLLEFLTAQEAALQTWQRSFG